jgi:hypothetical protein
MVIFWFTRALITSVALIWFFAVIFCDVGYGGGGNILFVRMIKGNYHWTCFSVKNESIETSSHVLSGARGFKNGNKCMK